MLRTMGGICLAGLLLSAGCSSQVALRPGKSCDSGNVDVCRESCDQNQARACYRLGWFYEEGQGVKQSHNKAVELYERACDANMAIACRGLGIMYWRGEAVKRSRKKAIAFYQKACGLGLPEACPTPEMLAEAEGRKGSKPSGSFGVQVQVGQPDEPSGSDGPDAPATPETPETPAPETPEAPAPEAPTKL
jgi:hypothetical protein